MRDAGLSDFDVMWARCVNWGRWGRQDSCRPDPEAGTGSIYSMGRADRQGDQLIEGDDGEYMVDAEEPPLPPIDSRDADLLDGYIRQLGAVHRNSVRTYFYRRQYVSRPALDEAVRMLCDMEEANARTRTAMRGRV